jgi:DNA polymerase III subunit epsilon
MPPPYATASGGFAVVDVEASGSSSRRHRVIELAVVLLDREVRFEGEFSTLVDPQGPVGPTHIHGIEDWQLSGAPRFAGVAARLLGLLRGRALVGHNVGCDRAFLAAEYARVGVRLPAVPELCTMRMAAERAGEGPVRTGLSLRACAAAYGVPGDDPHTALGDARATAALFGHFVAQTRTPGGAFGPGGLEATLSQAAGVHWPEAPGLLRAPDSLWKQRSNDSARRSVPNVRHGSA